MEKPAVNTQQQHRLRGSDTAWLV